MDSFSFAGSLLDIALTFLRWALRAMRLGQGTATSPGTGAPMHPFFPQQLFLGASQQEAFLEPIELHFLVL
jgi:hypothetical protein